MTTAPPRPVDQTKRNQAEFWNARQAAASDEKQLAAVMYDLARSTAAKVAGRDPNHPIWRELAETLHRWSVDTQRALPASDAR
ncbi:hypothetical protein ABZT02_44910 [Streptomyces sp. NPDC005402]|uniref:hypothetical protein n=1 Tax=Streptomyces sp. NPDC005402 TaxID=3155338 RepID=UPI0033A910E6